MLSSSRVERKDRRLGGHAANRAGPLNTRCCWGLGEPDPPQHGGGTKHTPRAQAGRGQVGSAEHIPTEGANTLLHGSPRLKHPTGTEPCPRGRQGRRAGNSSRSTEPEGSQNDASRCHTRTGVDSDGGPSSPHSGHGRKVTPHFPEQGALGLTAGVPPLAASQPAPHVLLIQQGEGQDDGEHVEEVVVTREDDEDLQQDLGSSEGTAGVSQCWGAEESGTPPARPPQHPECKGLQSEEPVLPAG